MKRVFRAEIIWDTNDEHGLVSAIRDFVEELNKIKGIEAIEPHVYPEDPIVIIITKQMEQ